MTLDSGDRIFFDITFEQMTLQVLSFENLAGDGRSENGRGDCDTVVLCGRDVALLLGALDHMKSRSIVEQRPGTSALSAMGTDEVLYLSTGENVVALTAPEREMLSGAIRSRAWRLFQ